MTQSCCGFKFCLGDLFETRSLPTLARCFTLITRPPVACTSYPSCVAVYPRNSRSRRDLMSLVPLAPFIRKAIGQIRRVLRRFFLRTFWRAIDEDFEPTKQPKRRQRFGL
jgi:hypothetical protein